MDELRAVLELTTEEELQHLTQILFSRKFNPLDYIHTPEPIDVQSQDRKAWVDAVEERFRFLAADGLTVLRNQTRHVSYRQILIQVCRYLKIPYSHKLSTVDLEAELFLSLMGRAWKKLPNSQKEVLTAKIQKCLVKSQCQEPLPIQLQKDPVGLIVKGGGALAISSLIKPWLLQQIARQFAFHFASYQVAKEGIIKGGMAAATQFQNYMLLQTAGRGMAINAARYGTVRSALSLLGPIMWMWFFADLGWRAIATNYGRIIPTIIYLAQIRLTRSECWEFVG